MSEISFRWHRGDESVSAECSLETLRLLQAALGSGDYERCALNRPVALEDLSGLTSTEPKP